MEEYGSYAGSPWTIQNRVTLKPQGFTDEAIDCNVVGVHNLHKLTLAHLNPFNLFFYGPEPIEEALQEDISKLAETGPVQGLLTGGINFLPHPTLNNKSENSLALFQTLLTILKKQGV